MDTHTHLWDASLAKWVTGADPRDVCPRSAPVRGGPRAVGLEGCEALHRRVERRLAWLQAGQPDLRAVLREVHRARHQQRPRPQGPVDLALLRRHEAEVLESR